MSEFSAASWLTVVLPNIVMCVCVFKGLYALPDNKGIILGGIKDDCKSNLFCGSLILNCSQI